MKPALFAVLAVPVLCTSLLYPQATPPNPPATTPSNDHAKAAATPANAGASEAAPAAAAPEAAGSAKEVTAPAAKPAKAAEVTEAELKERLTGRPLFLRGLWLDETLHFNMNGDLVGTSAKG